MESCRACGGKRVCHTATGIEKQSETKTESDSQTVLWQPQKIFHHIKRKNNKTNNLFPALNKGRGLSQEQQRSSIQKKVSEKT
jgi:hypothetical protein